MVRDRPGARHLARPRGRVAFEDVAVRYPGATRDALAGLSFEVEPGATLAVVGPSGAGKSTVLKLLLRMLEPARGRVLLDGHDVRDLTLVSARAAVALVPQEGMLFHATVRENIAYGRPGASPHAVEAAARAADAHAFIAALPGGYDAVIGDKGRCLSGGQRQRLALARAILRGAPVLLLDEPTTGLDAVSAERVLALLRAAASRQACLLVTHDLRAAAHASEIVVLDEGRVIERGAHRALLRAGGAYAALWHRQAALPPAGALRAIAP